MIRVLLIDDQPVFRKGIVQVLKEDKENRRFEVCETGTRKEGINLIQSRIFDIVILNISANEASSLNLLNEILTINRRVRILFMSNFKEVQFAINILRYGAAGCLCRACKPDELINAIFKVSQGYKYISSSILQKMTFNLINYDKRPLHNALSARELEVVMLIASGKKLSEIANDLSLSPKTISVYRGRILDKLRVKSTSDIIRYAIKEKLIV